MVERGEYADETIPADAKNQQRRTVWDSSSSSAALQKQRMEGPNYCCFTANILALFPRKNGICDGKNRNERADKRTGDGF